MMNSEYWQEALVKSVNCSSLLDVNITDIHKLEDGKMFHQLLTLTPDATNSTLVSQCHLDVQALTRFLKHSPAANISLKKISDCHLIPLSNSMHVDQILKQNMYLSSEQRVQIVEQTLEERRLEPKFEPQHIERFNSHENVCLYNPRNIVGHNMSFQFILCLMFMEKYMSHLKLQEQLQDLRKQNRVMSEGIVSLQKEFKKSFPEHDTDKRHNSWNKKKSQNTAQGRVEEVCGHLKNMNVKLHSIFEEKKSLEKGLAQVQLLLTHKENEMILVHNETILLEHEINTLHKHLKNTNIEPKEKKSIQVQTHYRDLIRSGEETTTLPPKVESAVRDLLKEAKSTRISLEKVKYEICSLKHMPKVILEHYKKEIFDKEATVCTLTKRFDILNNNIKLLEEENIIVNDVINSKIKTVNLEKIKTYVTKSCEEMEIPSSVKSLMNKTCNDCKNMHDVSEEDCDTTIEVNLKFPKLNGCCLLSESEKFQAYMLNQNETISSLLLQLKAAQQEKCELQGKINEMIVLNRNLCSEKENALMRKNMLRETIKEMQKILQKKAADHRLKSSSKEVMRMKAAYKLLNDENHILQTKYCELKIHMNSMTERYERKLEFLKDQMLKMFNDEISKVRKYYVKKKRSRHVHNICDTDEKPNTSGESTNTHSSS